MVQTIANNFITERASNEAIAVGLNAVREICTRAPLCLGADLLRDLAQYRTYRDKNVVSAARSLIGLFRQLDPTLLAKKDRGRPTQSQLETMAGAVNTETSDPSSQFGRSRALNFIPGAEILTVAEEQSEIEQCVEKKDIEDSDSDSSWVNVVHSSDDEASVSGVQVLCDAINNKTIGKESMYKENSLSYCLIV